jgi:hypothetical protein
MGNIVISKPADNTIVVIKDTKTTELTTPVTRVVQVIDQGPAGGQGVPGPQGAQGLVGPTGAQGPPGPDVPNLVTTNLQSRVLWVATLADDPLSSAAEGDLWAQTPA